MSNMPVFYVDELMHFLRGEEWKVLAFLTHKIVGDKIPFEGEQFARFGPDDIPNGTGLQMPAVVRALGELATYGIIMPAQTDQGIAWMLCPLDEVDLKGLASRKKAGKK